MSCKKNCHTGMYIPNRTANEVTNTELLAYDYMRRAFLVGLLLAIIIPCIGVIIIMKRLSMIGDALSHSSLAGVAAGLVLGINPIAGAAVMSVIAALGIEFIRRRFPRYAELSVAVVMSAGVGLAGVLSGFAGSAAGFNSFLFGSIVTIDDFELFFVITLACIALALFIVLYKELFFLALDERAARLAGIPVNIINLVFTVLTAVTVSAAARTVGALVVSSLMVLPVACAIQVAKSYLQTVLYGVGFGILFTLGGLTASFYLGTRPGGTIVLIGVAVLLLVLLGKRLKRNVRIP